MLNVSQEYRDMIEVGSLARGKNLYINHDFIRSKKARLNDDFLLFLSMEIRHKIE